MTTKLRDLIFSKVGSSDTIQDTETFALTVMPDHIHWLFRLGKRLSLGRVVGRFKVETRRGLAEDGLGWQRDFFEHRLRGKECVEGYGRYIFLNPYRAGLRKPTASWPGWLCPKPAQFEFLEQLKQIESVPQEWIGVEERIGATGSQTGRD